MPKKLPASITEVDIRYSTGPSEMTSRFSFRIPDPGELSLDRLKGLSDGVVAIVLTLLVLGIEVPQGHGFAEEGLLSYLLKIEYQVTVYAVSFVLIGGYWISHTVMFHYFRHSTRGLLWFNLLFLFLLTLLPFATQLIGTYQYEPIVIVIYGAVNIATGCSLAFMWWGANRLVPVVWPRIDNQVVRGMQHRIMLGPLICLIAIAVAFLNVRLSHVVFLTIPFMQLQHRSVDRHWAELLKEEEDENAGVTK
jgi:uncharacterized membrane protein